MNRTSINTYILFVVVFALSLIKTSTMGFATIDQTTPTTANASSEHFIYLPIITAPDGTWQEVGIGSASGGGISNNSSYSSIPSIDISLDGHLYITWADDADGDFEIYVLTWTGIEWTEVGENSASGGGISNNDGDSGSPNIAISPNGMPYVVWMDNSSGAWRIYIRAWNGSAWVELEEGSGSGGGVVDNLHLSDLPKPKIAIAPDGILYLTWYGLGYGAEEIYVLSWNGENWSEVGAGSASEGGISNSFFGSSGSPSIAVAQDGTPYMAWHEWNSSEGIYDIYVRVWDGNSWVELAGSATGGGISNNPGFSFSPTIVIAPNGVPFVAWSDNISGSWEILIRTWDGNSWEEVGTGSPSGGEIQTNGEIPIASFDIAPDGTAYITWAESVNAKHEIYVQYLKNNLWSEVGINSASSGGISNTSERSSFPTIEISPIGIPYIVWEEYIDYLNRDIYILRFDH